MAFTLEVALATLPLTGSMTHSNGIRCLVFPAGNRAHGFRCKRHNIDRLQSTSPTLPVPQCLSLEVTSVASFSCLPWRFSCMYTRVASFSLTSGNTLHTFFLRCFSSSQYILEIVSCCYYTSSYLILCDNAIALCRLCTKLL